MKHPPLTFEYSKITEHIYIGTNMCCQTHFKKSLIKKGIKADISLEDIKLDQPFGVDCYLWLPTKDNNPSSIKQLQAGTAFLKELKKQKVKCYVHCQRGHGRAPTLVAAFFISEGMKAEEAVNFIKKRRESIHPNKRQISVLKKFMKTVKS